jgi:hypothetical protein
MVSIAPAVTLLGIVAITYLFRAVAIIFAAPIVVVIFAGVSLPYVRDTLGEKTALTRKLRPVENRPPRDELAPPP